MVKSEDALNTTSESQVTLEVLRLDTGSAVAVVGTPSM